MVYASLEKSEGGSRMDMTIKTNLWRKLHSVSWEHSFQNRANIRQIHQGLFQYTVYFSFAEELEPNLSFPFFFINHCHHNQYDLFLLFIVFLSYLCNACQSDTIIADSFFV